MSWSPWSQFNVFLFSWSHMFCLGLNVNGRHSPDCCEWVVVWACARCYPPCRASSIECHSRFSWCPTLPSTIPRLRCGFWAWVRVFDVCVCVCAHSYLCKGVNAIYIQREHIIDDPKAIRSYQTCWRSVPFAEAFLKGQNIVVSKSRILPHSFRANLSPSLIRFPCGSAFLSERNEICIAAIVR